METVSKIVDTDLKLLSNETVDLPPYWPLRFRIIMSIFLSVLMVFAIFGNLLVVAVIIKHRGMQTRTNMFLCNLAVTDILCGVFDMPITLVTLIKGDWIFPGWVCQLNGFSLPLFFVASIHTLMHISIHKYISIVHPFSLMLKRKRVVFIIIIAIWFWALFSGYLTIHGLNRVYYKPYTTQCGPDYPHDTPTYVHVWVILGTSFFIPLLVITFCYVRIYREIKAHAGRMERHTTMSHTEIYSQQRRITFTLLGVLAVFLVSWTPYILYSIYASTALDRTDVPRRANPMSYIFVYINSAFNPLIYAMGSPSFREGYKQILCFWRLKKITVVSEVEPSTSGAFGRVRMYIREALQATFHGPGDETGSSNTLHKRSLASLANGVLFPRPRTLSTFSLPQDFHFSIHVANADGSRKNRKSLKTLCDCFRKKEKRHCPKVILSPVAQFRPGNVYYPKAENINDRQRDTAMKPEYEGEEQVRTPTPKEMSVSLTKALPQREYTNRKLSLGRSLSNDNSTGHTSSPLDFSPSGERVTSVSVHIVDPTGQELQGNTALPSDHLSLNASRDARNDNSISDGASNMVHVKSDSYLELQDRKYSLSNMERKRQRSPFGRRLMNHVFRNSALEPKHKITPSTSSSPLLGPGADSRGTRKKDAPDILRGKKNNSINTRMSRSRSVTGKLTRCPSVEKLDTSKFRQRSYTVGSKKHGRKNHSDKNRTAEIWADDLASQVDETPTEKRRMQRSSRREGHVRSGSDPCVTLQSLEDKLNNRRETKNWYRVKRDKCDNLKCADSQNRTVCLYISDNSPTLEKSGFACAPNDLDDGAGVLSEQETHVYLSKQNSDLGTNPGKGSDKTNNSEDTSLNPVTPTLSSGIPLCPERSSTASDLLPTCDTAKNDISCGIFEKSENECSAGRGMPRSQSDNTGLMSEERVRLDFHPVLPQSKSVICRLSKIPEDPHERWTFKDYYSDGEGSDRETSL